MALVVYGSRYRIVEGCYNCSVILYVVVCYNIKPVLVCIKHEHSRFPSVTRKKTTSIHFCSAVRSYLHTVHFVYQSTILLLLGCYSIWFLGCASSSHLFWAPVYTFGVQYLHTHTSRGHKGKRKVNTRSLVWLHIVCTTSVFLFSTSNGVEEGPLCKRSPFQRQL